MAGGRSSVGVDPRSRDQRFPLPSRCLAYFFIPYASFYALRNSVLSALTFAFISSTDAASQRYGYPHAPSDRHAHPSPHCHADAAPTAHHASAGPDRLADPRPHPGCHQPVAYPHVGPARPRGPGRDQHRRPR